MIRQVTNDQINYIIERIDYNLLIPELYRVNQWNLNTFGDKESGIEVSYLYLREPEPRFDLDALHECFKSYFRSVEKDPNSSVSVGGSLHKYEKKKVLSLKTFRINPSFLDLSQRNNLRNVTARKLTVRMKEKGFTLVFWTTSCVLYLYKNYELLEMPRDFVRKFLNEIEYPKFVIRHRLSRSTPRYFMWWYNSIVHARSGLFKIQI